MRMEACTTQGNIKRVGNGRNIQYSHERSIAITITEYTFKCNNPVEVIDVNTIELDSDSDSIISME